MKFLFTGSFPISDIFLAQLTNSIRGWPWRTLLVIRDQGNGLHITFTIHFHHLTLTGLKLAENLLGLGPPNDDKKEFANDTASISKQESLLFPPEEFPDTLANCDMGATVEDVTS